MSLETLFREAVVALRQHDVSFAVAGGLAADLYRQEARLTMDVDLAIVARTHELRIAVSVVESLGLHAGIAREADLAGGPMFAIRRQNTKACLVVGRPADNPSGEGVDILLSTIPWAPDAVARAQCNLVDFGFGAIPVLTVEDTVLSKLYALKSAHLRAKDLDDLQSIFSSVADVDLAYVSGRMHALGITVPKAAEPFLPDLILKISRDIVRSAKR